MRRTLTLSVLLTLFAGVVVSQVPDDVHEKCKDARDYVGCIQVLTGATISKEEAEIEEIKNLKKALALLPSRLQNTSLSNFSMAIQPFTDALAAAEAVAIVSSDYSIEDKTKILKLINPSLRLSRAIDIYRATWNQSIEYSVEFENFPLDCSMFDWTIDSFNRIMESNVLDYENVVVRIFSEDMCRTRNYRFERTMQYYIVEASKNILREGKFPKFSKPYKDLTAIKAEWYEANTYDLSEYKSRALEYSNKYSRNENDEQLSRRQTKKIHETLWAASRFEDPTLVQIKKMDELLVKFQKRRSIPLATNCSQDGANITFSIKLAKFYYDTKEGTRESNLQKVEELSLAVLAANWDPYLLTYESCTKQELYFVPTSSLSVSDYLSIAKSSYEGRVRWVNQAQELLAKVEKERAIN